MKKSVFFIIFMAFLMVSCAAYEPQPSYAEVHDAFQTKLLKHNHDNTEIPIPPEGVFDYIRYPSRIGDLAAYVSSDPNDGQKHPMIIWIAGGWANSIDEFPWTEASWDNDQTASAFWKSGVLTMYPSFRGGNDNPGNYETLFGEIDDIVSAYEYAASLPYVDSKRIYLGGHSTGGTHALLVAEYTDKFRGIFSFGPVDKIESYGVDQLEFDIRNEEEFIVRSPVYWLNDVKTPTFIIEGIDGNSICVKNMKQKTTNENIDTYIIEDADHFSVLAPISRIIAKKIINDTGEKTNITFTQEELQVAMSQEP